MKTPEKATPTRVLALLQMVTDIGSGTLGGPQGQSGSGLVTTERALLA